MAQNTNLGGYAVTSVKSHDGRDGLAFTAVITKDGKKVMRVSNTGSGGCNSYDAVGPFKTTEDADKAYPAFLAAYSEFETFAKAWNEGNEFAGYEDCDQFISHLLDYASLSRSRRIPFLLDDMDFDATGECHKFSNPLTYEQVVEVLKAQYSTRNPRIWNKTLNAFVPVV